MAAPYRISARPSKIDGSSFSGSLTLVKIGQICIGSAGNGRSRSLGSG
jgi:hypothetical protein